MTEKFRPKKMFSQNFLINTSVIHKIIQLSNVKPDENVLEIGPGRGALTQLLCERAKYVFAIEKDHHCVDYLKSTVENHNITFFNEDILTFDWRKIPTPFKLVGNLPYNIATPIIEKAIAHRELISQFYFMVQKEHGKRIIAKPHTKDYGSFSCFVQFYAKPKICFNITNKAFKPSPKVQSCFIEMNFNKEERKDVLSEEFLFKVIRTGFGQRRKKIINNFSSIADKETLSTLFNQSNLSTDLRAENLSIEDFIKLTNLMQSDSFKKRFNFSNL